MPIAPAPAQRYTGFSTPESVLYDSRADVYLVSNIDGTPFAKDDRAFISRLSPSGEVEALRWIDSATEGVTLNAPKGMAFAGDHLYVADIDTVRVFNREDGTPVGEIAIEGASFLNDVAADASGRVFVTDSGLLQTPEGGFGESGTDALYRVALGEAPVEIVRGPELKRPNGILATDEGLFVATFGANEILKITEDGAIVSRITTPSGSLDGLVRLPSGEFLVSSWDASAVLRGGEGSFVNAVEGVVSPADIGFDDRRGLVLVPLFSADEVVAVPAGH
ncbi:MAG: hypothetical protein H5U40_04560 [Polyangiaceae bacterium]|nr:hypothetical protein [Polyangiaceae bacterium]